MTTRTGSRQTELIRSLSKAAQALKQDLSSIEKKRLCIALAGGRSAELFYPYVKRVLDSDSLKGKQIEFFLLDERLSTRQRNSTLIKRVLGKRALNLQTIGIEKRETILRRYNQRLKASCDGGFDIIIAGVGEDGHIASLFPHSRELADKSQGYILVEDSPKPPRQRITASPNLILRARFIYLLFLGESKRKAFLDFKNPKISIDSCPAKIAYKTYQNKGDTKLRIISDLNEGGME